MIIKTFILFFNNSYYSLTQNVKIRDSMSRYVHYDLE